MSTRATTAPLSVRRAYRPTRSIIWPTRPACGEVAHYRACPAYRYAIMFLPTPTTGELTFYDVAIVGGGPAGAATAIRLAGAGIASCSSSVTPRPPGGHAACSRRHLTRPPARPGPVANEVAALHRPINAMELESVGRAVPPPVSSTVSRAASTACASTRACSRWPRRPVRRYGARQSCATCSCPPAVAPTSCSSHLRWPTTHRRTRQSARARSS